TILDNGSSGFSTTGTWSDNSPNGFAYDSLRADNGDTASTASWMFPNLVPGQYRVSVTWPQDPGAAIDAPFTLLVNGQVVATATLNQRLAPAGLSDGKTTWQDLALALNVPHGPVEVRLSNAASGPVLADAVRVERVNMAVQDSTADVARFLEQATWGPNTDLLTSVQQ